MRKLSLFNNFTIFSFIAFTATGILLISFLDNHMKEDELRYTKKTIHLSLYYLVQPELTQEDFGNILDDKKRELLNRNLEQMVKENNISEIRIWNREKKNIYSYKNTYINNEKSYSENINQALLNKPNNIIDSKNDILRLALPVSYGNKVIGVYEVFKPYRDIAEHVNNVRKITTLIIFSGLLILYIFLLKIVYNSSKALIMHNEMLQKHTDELKEAYSKLNASYKNTIITLSNAVDARDPYTAGHSERVAKISVQIGKILGLTPAQLETLELAALFHDIGKIGIEDKILHKPGKLTEEEYNKIKEHSAIGVNILKNIDFLKNILSIVLYHHERFDGQGYPSGICKDEIPIEARIIAAADAYDAMTSDRPYRKGFTTNIAVEELRRFENVQFDKRVVDALVELVS